MKEFEANPQCPSAMHVTVPDLMSVCMERGVFKTQLILATVKQV